MEWGALLTFLGTFEVDSDGSFTSVCGQLRESITGDFGMVALLRRQQSGGQLITTYTSHNIEETVSRDEQTTTKPHSRP